MKDYVCTYCEKAGYQSACTCDSTERHKRHACAFCEQHGRCSVCGKIICFDNEDCGGTGIEYICSDCMNLVPVKEIIRESLERNGYDGLVNREKGCACPNDDLALCGKEIPVDCVVAREVKCLKEIL